MPTIFTKRLDAFVCGLSSYIQRLRDLILRRVTFALFVHE
ncbi:hypothetical protein B4090_4014 [Bacillus licheniformis]|nr:hypothetical protein B4090_4014 [Bacillus licheniformis]